MLFIGPSIIPGVNLVRANAMPWAPRSVSKKRRDVAEAASALPIGLAPRGGTTAQSEAESGVGGGTSPTPLPLRLGPAAKPVRSYLPTVNKMSLADDRMSLLVLQLDRDTRLRISPGLCGSHT